MNKVHLLEKIQSGHRQLEEALAKIDPQDMECTTSKEGWTVKETLVHLTSWEKVLMEDHASLRRGEKIHELSGQGEIDARNAETRERAGHIPLDQAVAEFDDTYRQLLQWLENLPESELDRPFAYGMTLGEFVGEDTWKHYAEHLENITAKIR
jgi:hypothetical protein